MCQMLSVTCQVARVTCQGSCVCASAYVTRDTYAPDQCVYSLRLLMKLSNIPVNSIGKMYLVEALAPIDLSVSKYCRVIVFGSTVLAVSNILANAAEKPSARSS